VRAGDAVVAVALDPSRPVAVRGDPDRGDAHRARGYCCGRCGRGSTTPPRPGGCWPASSPRSPAPNGS
jgi:hypothetical protein